MRELIELILFFILMVMFMMMMKMQTDEGFCYYWMGKESCARFNEVK